MAYILLVFVCIFSDLIMSNSFDASEIHENMQTTMANNLSAALILC